MALDKEQKRMVQAFAGTGLGMVAGTLLYYACSGKFVESWTDALSISVLNLLIVIGLGALFIFGSKTPKKDK